MTPVVAVARPAIAPLDLDVARATYQQHCKDMTDQQLTCDAEGCTAELRGDWEYGLMYDARTQGWQLRPSRGKGSRTAPDLCPSHRTDGEVAS